MSESLSGRPEGKRARTRAALVKAALDVAAEKGLAAASLDEIAARAGMTKGAIYSNFSSKAELLLAAMEAKGLTLAAPRADGMTLAEELAATAADLTRTIRRAQGEEAFLLEFQVHALSDPELRKGLAAAYGEGFTETAAYLAGLAGPAPALPPRELAVALQAVAMGFMVQSFLTPDDITDALIRAVFEALAVGLVTTRSPQT